MQRMARDDEGGVGRPVNPDSLRSKLNRGEARSMHVILPEELHRGLRVQAALTDRRLSELVAEAVREWLDRQEAPK